MATKFILSFVLLVTLLQVRTIIAEKNEVEILNRQFNNVLQARLTPQVKALPARPAMLLPPRIIRPIFPRPRPRPIFTTPTPFTTPSMVDVQTWNFTAPSVIAKDCLNAIGKSIVGYCQSKAESDWDPVKMNTSSSTTWETCCSLFEELDCYVKNAGSFCPAATRNALIAYSRKVGGYMEAAICKTISFRSWQYACNNISHATFVQATNSSLKNPDTIHFVDLPAADGPEMACFTQLRNATVNKVTVNLEQTCLNKALNKWDPARNKLLQSGLIDSCCAIYDTLDCIQAHSISVCTAAQSTDMDNYRKKSAVSLDSTICKTVPYEKADKLCSGKSGSYDLLASLLTLVTTFLAILHITF